MEKGVDGECVVCCLPHLRAARDLEMVCQSLPSLSSWCGISAEEELHCCLKVHLCMEVCCRASVLSAAPQGIYCASACQRASQCRANAVHALFLLAAKKIAGLDSLEDVISVSAAATVGSGWH